MSKEDLEKMEPEDLDELVHEMKASEAAAINNDGKEAQIEYLLAAGV